MGIRLISSIPPNTSNSNAWSNSIQSTIGPSLISSGSSTATNATQKTKESKLSRLVSSDPSESTAQDIRTQAKLWLTIQVAHARQNWRASPHHLLHHHPCHQWRIWFSTSSSQLLPNNWSTVHVSSVSFPISATTRVSNGSRTRSHSRLLRNILSKLARRLVLSVYKSTGSDKWTWADTLLLSRLHLACSTPRFTLTSLEAPLTACFMRHRN